LKNKYEHDQTLVGCRTALPDEGLFFVETNKGKGLDLAEMLEIQKVSGKH